MRERKNLGDQITTTILDSLTNILAEINNKIITGIMSTFVSRSTCTGLKTNKLRR